MATTPLRLQRCWNHDYREAVSRCPGCQRSFCRECVTEFEGRVLCASCLKQATTKAPVRQWRLTGVWRTFGLLTGFLLGWWTVYAFGQLLLMIPTSFHEGGAWLGR